MVAIMAIEGVFEEINGIGKTDLRWIVRASSFEDFVRRFGYNGLIHTIHLVIDV